MKRQNGFGLIYRLYIKKQCWGILFVLLMVLLAAVFGFAENWLNQYLIDDIIGNSRYEHIFSFLAVYAAVNLICVFLSYVVGKANIIVSQKCSVAMREDLMDRIHKADLSSLFPKKLSEYVVRMMEDVTTVCGFFNNVLVGKTTTLFSILIMSVYLFYYSKWITLIIYIFSFMQLAVTWLFAKQIRERQREGREITQEHMSGLSDNILNVHAIKAFSLGSRMKEKYRGILLAITNITKRNYNLEYVMNLLMFLIGMVCDATVILIGIQGVRENEITLGVLVVIMSLSGTVRSLFMGLSDTTIYLQQLAVSINRLCDIIFLKQEETLLPYADRIETISFDNISFTYEEGNENTIDAWNAVFSKEKTNVLVGESGCGKSTVLNLIMQFYRPAEGTILINNKPLDKSQTIRNKISVCFQTDCFVYDTVRDNLCLQEYEVPAERVDHILKMVEADSFISKLENGLDSTMGELSKRFSGGELKRLSIARTLLRDADVYIFDESFANIDEEMRARIFSRIREEYKDKIIIVITHDYDFLQGHELEIIKMGGNNER